MELTIAIPTYDRPASLRRTLAQLVPQLTTDTRLLIVDNHSDRPAGDVVADLLRDCDPSRVDVLRNRANIGGNANIMRCFELCETERLWIVGDDDLVTPDAVATILTVLSEDPASIYHNFCAEVMGGRPTTWGTQGRQGFLHGIDSFNRVLFLPLGVWHADHLRPFLKFGYHYASTLAPHIAALLMSLDGDARCCFSSRRVLQAPAAASDTTLWAVSLYPFLLSLQELPLPDADRALINKVVGDEVARYLPSYVVRFASMTRSGLGPRSALYLYDLLRFRLLALRRDPVMALKLLALRPLVRAPRTADTLYRRLRGRGLEDAPNSDLFERW